MVALLTAAGWASSCGSTGNGATVASSTESTSTASVAASGTGTGPSSGGSGGAAASSGTTASSSTGTGGSGAGGAGGAPACAATHFTPAAANFALPPYVAQNGSALFNTGGTAGCANNFTTAYTTLDLDGDGHLDLVVTRNCAEVAPGKAWEEQA